MTAPADRPASGATFDPIAVGSAGRTSSQARILDRGYRRYSGPLRGTRGAITTLAINTAQRALGLRRSFWSKIFPILAISFAYIPAIVFVGVTVLVADLPGGPQRLDELQLLPPIPNYYNFITSAVLIFVAFVAPEVLCTDRRNGMLGLYLASPLNRNTYLLAKALAIAGILGLVTLGPPLLYLLGLTLNDRGPDGFGGFLEVLLKVIVAGICVATMQVTLSLAVASTTTRRAAASVAVVLILLSTAIVAETLVDAAGVNANVLLFNLTALPLEVVHRLFGQGHVDPAWRVISTPVLYAAYAGWTFLFGVFVWYRYRRLQVTR